MIFSSLFEEVGLNFFSSFSLVIQPFPLKIKQQNLFILDKRPENASWFCNFLLPFPYKSPRTQQKMVLMSQPRLRLRDFLSFSTITSQKHVTLNGADSKIKFFTVQNPRKKRERHGRRKHVNIFHTFTIPIHFSFLSCEHFFHRQPAKICNKYSDSQKHESSCLLSDSFWCISPEPFELHNVSYTGLINTRAYKNEN